MEMDITQLINWVVNWNLFNTRSCLEEIGNGMSVCGFRKMDIGILHYECQ